MILVIPSQRETVPRRKREISTADFTASQMAFAGASSFRLGKKREYLPA
jgi:hypothetical protein